MTSRTAPPPSWTAGSRASTSARCRGALPPRSPRARVLPAVFLPALLLTGCGVVAAEPGSSPDSPTPTPVPSAGDGTGTDPTEGTGGEGASAAADPEDTTALEGLVVALDPGHNGGNSGAPSEINAPVDDGRGGTKACNTTGTATASDYAEHTFNWEVSQELQDLLERSGAEVVLSRKDDEGVGPCVDERGAFADEADLMVSIHANGTEDSSAQGFHVIVPEANDRHDDAEALAESARALGEEVAAAFVAHDLDPNPAYGEDGIVERADIAGLAHASVPAVMVECGEMRNAEDAARMESEEGRAAYAQALFDGIVEYAAASTDP
ncbi:N-acetylmuramoyl-L-alanine amidase [Brevibacterium litoralis]|uniref:N-acetylmuramoyl-L-alanine amidase n=1 Tax=Brevibacterium litoralis TaxID=3138935 RepID=UPI0032EB121C